MHEFPVRSPDQLPALLQSFRKAAGLTQAETALRLGVTQQTYSALERNASKVSADDATFGQLTDTIVRQVGDLRNMVDEFSSFARMPKPLFRAENIHDIVGHAVFMFEVAHSDIMFTYNQIGAVPNLISDRRQLGQAITNILKNAVESIEEKRKLDPIEGAISIDLLMDEEALVIRIADNGIGLPPDRARLCPASKTTPPPAPPRAARPPWSR